MLRSFPFRIVDELNHSGMPELNIRHQRFVLLRAKPIVVRLFCVALTQRIDECKLSHDPIFGVDGILAEEGALDCGLHRRLHGASNTTCFDIRSN